MPLISAIIIPGRFDPRWLAAALLVLAVATAPFWTGRAELRLFSEFFSFVALAVLWNLLAGYAGLLSVGQQAFVGLGGMCFLSFAASTESRPISPFLWRSLRREPWRPFLPRFCSALMAPISRLAPGSQPKR